ncbi:MAG TPA: hypothetical protein VMW56_18185, partial [Candidatus Margulisiibacteriota bacterium]|nr:hypothetical protein [Candidatus Margulisiibacteriota bacterium]
HAMHPGWADTPSVRSSIPRFWRLMRKRLRTPEQGADTLVWLAAAPPAALPVALPSGQFWFDRAPQPTHLLPFTTERPRDRARLWRTCKRLAGLAQSAHDLRRAQA